MKKIILSLVLSGIFISVNAQTEKGDWMVGGRVDLNAAEDATHIGFSPGAAVFVAHNFAVGGNLVLDYNKSGDTKITSFGIGPLFRYYFTNAMVKPLIQVAVNYVSVKVSGPGFSATNDAASFFIGGGAAVFINQNVALEPILGYTNTDGNGGFSFGLGFQVYLSKGQVDKVRGK